MFKTNEARSGTTLTCDYWVEEASAKTEEEVVQKEDPPAIATDSKVAYHEAMVET